MMAIIGFIALFVIGAILVLRAGAMAALLKGFGGSLLSDGWQGFVWMLGHLLVGGALIVLAIINSPFTISISSPCVVPR